MMLRIVLTISLMVAMIAPAAAQGSRAGFDRALQANIANHLKNRPALARLNDKGLRRCKQFRVRFVLSADGRVTKARVSNLTFSPAANRLIEREIERTPRMRNVPAAARGHRYAVPVSVCR